MKKKFFQSVIALFIAALCLSPVFAVTANAQSGGPDFGTEYAEETGLGDTDPRQIMTNLLNLAMTFLSIISVIIILIGGFKWMTAAGNEDKVSEAKKIVIGGVIGLVIILASWAIASFVLTTVADKI